MTRINQDGGSDVCYYYLDKSYSAIVDVVTLAMMYGGLGGMKEEAEVWQ